MCGIAGGWRAGGLPPPVVQQALESLVHRGPDDWGEHHDGPVSLGMRRLSIIDVVGGHQPISNEDGTIWVVFNGEIYNYRELAESLRQQGHHLRTATDTEVLVHLYEDHGERMCEHLRGMFAFAVWDARRRRLFLARDRWGKKPLYYASPADGTLLFASEMKALRRLLHGVGGQPEINPQALYDYLSLGYVPQPATINRGVECIAPGGWLSYDGKQCRTGIYWSIEYGCYQHRPFDEVLEQTRALIAESVRLRLRSDVPIGVFLSGGVDSSVVAWEAARQVGESLQTFTVSTGHPELDEADVAARTAEALGVRHTILPMHVAPRDEILPLVRQYDQPFSDSAALPSMAISRLARQHVTVILSGDGGDEVFAGYRRYLAAYVGQHTRWLPRGVARAMVRASGWATRRRRSSLGLFRRFLRTQGLPPGARYLAWTSDMFFEEEKRRIWLGGRMRPTEQWIESILPAGLSLVESQVCGDHRVNMLSDQLVKTDIATMAASLEARCPLLDHTIGEFVLGVPPAQRLHRWRRKALLREGYRGRLSDEVLDGRKRGFEVPMRVWLENDLRDLVDDALRSPAAHVRQFVDGQFVDQLLNRQVLRERNWDYLVYGLLILEIWLRESHQPVGAAARPQRPPTPAPRPLSSSL